MDSEEDVPEYIKRLEYDPCNQPDHNFDASDVLWTGDDGELDPYDVLSKFGRDPNCPKTSLLMALILGHTPDANSQEVEKRLRKATAAITGKSRSGRPEKDDNDALLETAWRYNEAHYNSQPGEKIELRGIVRAVVEEFCTDLIASRNVTKISLIESLENKFERQRNCLLSRATTDDGWDRYGDYRKLQSVISTLHELGVPIDGSAVRVLHLRKNKRRTGDKTPRG